MVFENERSSAALINAFLLIMSFLERTSFFKIQCRCHIYTPQSHHHCFLQKWRVHTVIKLLFLAPPMGINPGICYSYSSEIHYLPSLKAQLQNRLTRQTLSQLCSFKIRRATCVEFADILSQGSKIVKGSVGRFFILNTHIERSGRGNGFKLSIWRQRENKSKTCLS